MKKILGLDLGVSSIGWALIEEGDEGQNNSIIGMGVRIVPLTTDEKDEFSKGNKISKNQKRTLYRSQRRGLDRYQQRREKLKRVLTRENMFPEDYLLQLSNLEVYGLRSRAASQKIDPRELGRVLLHLNQRRGYRGTRAEEAEEAASSKKTESSYLSAVKNRHQQILEKNQTVGQYFFEELVENPRFRIKNLVFPRKAYIEEFNAIAKAQGLSESLTRELRDEVIYFQRPLKSKKGLVRVCEFAGYTRVANNGVEKWYGPKVAPASSPIAQVCRVWEHINNLTIKTINNQKIKLTATQKRELFDIFNSQERVKPKDVIKALGYKEGDYKFDKLLEKGIQGNITYHTIVKILNGKYPNLLRFDLEIIEKADDPVFIACKKTGEILYQSNSKFVSPSFEKEPFYQLWHTIYSIQELQECTSALQKRFSIDTETAEKLAHLDFTKSGFGNKSVKAMRYILPYLMDGQGYSNACTLAGFNHSNSITKEENEERILKSRIALLPRNYLRQPVVEKILNQMIHVVNTLTDTYGTPDEIRVELARELRQSQEERNKAHRALNKREQENKKYAASLVNEFKIRATRNNIIKYRLYEQISGGSVKINATCLYCGKMFGFVDAMNGNGIDVEHIIPQQLRFDDSQNNKTLAHRSCNLEKGNMTAFDYMMTKSRDQFDAYMQRIDDFKDKNIISHTKHKNLITPSSELDEEKFIARQLQETRYISKKATALLRTNCRNVYVTTGKITEYLRRIWGWNDILLNLQLPKYKALNLTISEFRQASDGHLYTVETIPGWNKRKDHRHHAIDALVVASTKQGFINRLNTLSSKETRDFLYDQVREKTHTPGKLLERYLAKQRPFTTRETEDAAACILVSIKSGKRVATRSLIKDEKKTRGKNRLTGVLTPRGPLSEESIYGRIKLLTPNQPLKYLFEHPDRIVKDYIREKVVDRIRLFDGDAQKAFKLTKNDPIYLDEDKQTLLQYASCYEDKYVLRYPVGSIKVDDLKYIIDPVIRSKIRQRFELFNNDEKKALQGLDENPIWYNEEKKIPIRSVRCLRNLNAVEPIRQTNDIAHAFVKTGNNHHLAFFKDTTGNIIPHICTFWHAVDRKKYRFPIIIENPALIWQEIQLSAYEFPKSFLDKLPPEEYTFWISMQQNEMFLLGMEPADCIAALDTHDYKTLSPYLYRVQKISLKKTQIDISFRHHLETELDDSSTSKALKLYHNIQSIGALLKLNPLKIRINHIGQITNK